MLIVNSNKILKKVKINNKWIQWAVQEGSSKNLKFQRFSWKWKKSNLVEIQTIITKYKIMQVWMIKETKILISVDHNIRIELLWCHLLHKIIIIVKKEEKLYKMRKMKKKKIWIKIIMKLITIWKKKMKNNSNYEMII